jgi:hypothetical protein
MTVWFTPRCRLRTGPPPLSAWYRYTTLSTGVVESTVKPMVSKRLCTRQQMPWTKRGAHLLLQTRVKTLNRELGGMFRRWYPDLLVEEGPQAA